MSDEAKSRVTQEDLDLMFNTINHGDDAHVNVVRLLAIKQIAEASRYVLAFLCRAMFASLQEAQDAYAAVGNATEEKT